MPSEGQMRAILALGLLALSLAACASPDRFASDPGVGFTDYDTYAAQREAMLTGRMTGQVPGQVPGTFSAAAPLPTTSPYGMPPTAVPPGGIASSELAAA